MSRPNHSTRPHNQAVAMLYHAQTHKMSRPPMVNPYDKFTQPEFDAWIGDMTSTLRRALGYEQEVPVLLEKVHVNGAANGGTPKYRELDLSDQDELPDDSFAQIKTRRNKGKARDPREGPGLGKDCEQPIEVVSSDEEEEVEVEDLALSLRDDDSAPYDRDEEIESDHLWETSSPSNNLLASPPARIGPPTRSRQKDMMEVSDEGSDDGDSDECEDDEDFVKRANGTSEVITIISDEDESVEGKDEEYIRGFGYHDLPGPSSYQQPRDDSSEEDDVQGEDDEVDKVQPLGDDTSSPPHGSSVYPNLELNDPWEAPRKYAEDFYSGGELQLPAEVRVHPDHLGPFDEEIEAVEDEEFSRPDEVHDQHSEMFYLRPTSQDYYSKGNVIMPLDQPLDPLFFTRGEDEDSGVDSFLTSGVLAPNQSELRSHFDETGEDGIPQEGAQSFSPPIFTSVLPSRQNKPIPRDAEIVTVDDSDEEDGLQVIPPPDAILELVTEPATNHPEGPGVPESRSAHSPSDFPLVASIDNVGEDEVLSVHTAHTEDTSLENHLQPFEIVEPEAVDLKVAPKGFAQAFDVGPVLSEVVENEKQDGLNDIEALKPEVAPPNAIEAYQDTVSLDPKPITLEMDEEAPNYYEEFDDIYETPVPEVLPHVASNSCHLQLSELSIPHIWGHEDTNLEVEAPNDWTLQDKEVGGRPQDNNSAVFPTEKIGTEVNDHEVSEGRLPQWLENGVFVNDITIEGCSPETTPRRLPAMPSPSRSSTVPGQPQIPMPVLADATVPDPTESPTRLQEYPILSVPVTPDIVVTSLQIPQIGDELPGSPTPPPEPLLHSFNPNVDGLFTPADFSTVTTPAEDSTAPMLPSNWPEAEVASSQAVVPVDLDVCTELMDKPAEPSPKEVGHILTETDTVPSLAPTSKEATVSMHVPRMSVLMTDPYPYCLSTPMSDGESSEEIEDDSSAARSNSTEEEEYQKVEVESAVPLAANIEPHIPSPPTTTGLEGTTPLTEATDNPQVTTEDPMAVLATLDKDTVIGMEPQYLLPPTMRLDEPSAIPETSVEVSTKHDPATAQQPLEVGVDTNLQTFVQENSEVNTHMPNEGMSAFDSANPKDLHLPDVNEQVKQDDIPQITETISPARPSKRKRSTSPGFDESDDFPVKGKGNLQAKRLGKDVETETVEKQDTIHVRPRLYLKHEKGSTTSEPCGPIPKSVGVNEPHPVDKTPELSKAEVSWPIHPQLQFQVPSLFHAHGRSKRQKTHIQPIIIAKQMRDEDQPATPRTPVPENPPLESGTLPPRETVLPKIAPTTAEVVDLEVQEVAQTDSLSSAEPSQPDSANVVVSVPAVELPAQETPRTIPQPPSAVLADKVSQSADSIPITTVTVPALQSSPARFLPPSISTSSIRSTRSQCKYHKITLPKEEDGPRVCFLVPGCSLTNKELMEGEEIEDLGEATYEDSLGMIRDIDDLDFDQYLIGTLRQLVGLDILREGEVFYLPLPGDEVQRKHWPRKSISERTPTTKGNDYTSFAGSPGYSYSGSARSPSTRPPLSNADSISVSLSATATTDDGSDMDEKFTVTPGDRTSPSKGKRKSKARKGKTKDITFQPNEHDEESPHEESLQKKRRRSTTRGVKRTMTHDGATGNDGVRKSKRLRLHLTDSSLHQA